MKLHIPEQNTAAKSATPSHPRKLKKVLSTLPNSNMGELTKQTYFILRDLNRQTMPNKHRLEDLEMIRVLARNIFNNLKKYFINRTLPLPDKSRKIVNLNQSILQELIYGYEIIAYEAANKIDNQIDSKTLSIAICRAINYQSEMLLRSSEVYEPCPANLWQDTHQLYMLAESRKLTAKTVLNNELEQGKTTIEDSYKQILLFTLARPIALRQRDSERIYHELFTWSKFTDIKQQASEDQVDCVFCMRMTEDSPPNYLNKADLADTTAIRTLDTAKLISHVENLIAAQKKQHKLAIGDTIPFETLTALVSSWAESPKRRFTRAQRQGHINVAIGLPVICKAIKEARKKAAPVDTKSNVITPSGFLRTGIAQNEDPDFTLESLGNSENPFSDNYTTHTEINSKEDNAWDMVAKGRVVTNSYDKKQQLNEKKAGLHLESADSHWQVVNISAGGYCLRWNSDDTSKAQIGELIALQVFDNHHEFTWHVGIIRWMQFTQENGLEIGVQVISPNIDTATAQRANRPGEQPFDCLMLPAIKALNTASSTILPSHAFKPNDKLSVHILDNKLSITLGEIEEQTGSITQFTYKNTEEEKRIQKQVKKEQANKNKDDFDELWSSL